MGSVERGKQLVQDFFQAFPDESKLECVGTFCPRCKMIFASPRHIKTREIGEIDVIDYRE